MNKTKRNLLGVAGVFSIVFGIAFFVPSSFQANYLLAALSATLTVFGLVLLAIAFGD